MLSLLFGFVVSAVIFSLRVLRSGRFASSEVVALIGFVSLDLFLLGRSRVVSVGSSIDSPGRNLRWGRWIVSVDLRVSCVPNCGSLGELSCDSVFGSWSAHKCGHG